MPFDLVIPYAEMYPRKIAGRIVMEKIYILFLDNRIG